MVEKKISEANELFRRGQLEEAIAAQTEQVRENPTNLEIRTFYFVLMCFAGELDRAANALKVMQTQDESLAGGGALLLSLLSAEAQRRAVWREEGEPLLPPDAPAHLEIRVGALAALRGRDLERCDKLLDEAESATPELAGRVNGSAFGAIRDCDDLIGPALEVFAGGAYVWLPFERIRKLETEAPKRAIDLLWLPANLEDHGGTRSVVYLPSLYVHSHENPDPAVRLGRRTEWIELAPSLYRGAGQRVLLSAAESEESETPLLELRSLEIDAQGVGEV